MSKILDKIKSFFKANGEIITPTAVLAIICVVVTLALSSTNLLTADRILSLSIEKENNAMSKLIEADKYLWCPGVTDDDRSYNIAIKENEPVGIILTTEANGYGGVISVMTAVDMEGKIVAIEILEAADETPGLGQNVTKPDWYSQFSGLKNDITVIKGGSAIQENNEVNAVTGATISSKAVTTAVNQALDYAQEIIAKGDFEIEQ